MDRPELTTKNTRGSAHCRAETARSRIGETGCSRWGAIGSDTVVGFGAGQDLGAQRFGALGLDAREHGIRGR